MSTIKKIVVTSSTGGLKLLWSKGFFREWRDSSQIAESFATAGYHFTSGELGMALKRANFLTRRGSRGSYQYIQKYPFVETSE